MVSGYILGGLLTAKGITKLQEYLEIDFEEKRPVNDAIDKFEDIRDYLSAEEVEEDAEEAIEYFFEQENED